METSHTTGALQCQYFDNTQSEPRSDSDRVVHHAQVCLLQNHCPLSVAHIFATTPSLSLLGSELVIRFKLSHAPPGFDHRHFEAIRTSWANYELAYTARFFWTAPECAACRPVRPCPGGPCGAEVCQLALSKLCFNLQLIQYSSGDQKLVLVVQTL